ncbi:tetratricopeptide repeat protein [Hymenobacter sp. GOD-10R]|uniref:tetratricopeptide repeat protein n=1 Tax=Hymenobacter sp. GOD-10R TaxID=3093922 RepID=UPI002D797ACB|nr:tetratricopeptide repeat protein [Hymenobacter sp. GOD-10R]WRQ27547.1 tetratricopeptide repeat protein [Hymenobacter sp. GOD-10R]
MQQTHVDQWEAAAQHLLALHRPQQAEQLIRRHLAAHPQEAFAHILLGVALLRQKRRGEAYQAVKQGIALDPQLGDAYYLLSVIQLNDSQPFAALQAIQEALQLNPYNAKYLGQQALIFNTQGNYQDALQAAYAGLAFDPTHAECLVQAVQALQQLRHPKRASSVLQQLLSFHPTLPAAHILCGEEALSRQDFPKAEIHLRETLRLDPTHAKAASKLLTVLLHLGKAALSNHETTRAQLYFQEARQLDPENPEAYTGLRKTIKHSFRLKRFFERFDAYMHHLQRKNIVLLLLLCIVISFFCIPLLVLYVYASVQWRRHPEARLLRGTTVRPEPSLTPAGTPAKKVVGLLVLTVVLGGASWLNAADSPGLVWMAAFVLAVAWLEWAAANVNYAKSF